MDLEVQASNFKGLQEFAELIPINDSLDFPGGQRLELILAQPASMQHGVKSPYTVLVLPGGGYEFCSYREARVVAQAFARMGMNAAVLYYSVKLIQDVERDHIGLGTLPLEQTALAIDAIKHHAQWGLQDTKIVMCGFSAGGHLAACMCTKYAEIERKLNLKGSVRPDGAILSYPVISADPKLAHVGSFQCLTGSKDPKDWSEFSCDKLVTEHTPPTYIWHTAPDTIVPVGNSIIYAQSLWEHGCTAELHIYPEGEHGSSLSIDGVEPRGNFNLTDPYRATWFEQALNFVWKFV